MLRKTMGLMVTAGVIFTFTACGEGGINDKKDGNKTTMSDIESGVKNITDANTSTNTEIPDINTSMGDINGSVPNTNTGNIDSSIPDTNTGNIDSSVPDTNTGDIDSSIPNTNTGDIDGSIPDTNTETTDTGNIDNSIPDSDTKIPDTGGTEDAISNNDTKIPDTNIDNSIPDIGTGQYIDAAVKGVTYDCGNQDGVTDDNGTFKFEEGKKCIFSLGEIVLRELDPKDLKDKMVVIEDNIDNARLLQTLDNDGDSDNGIEITKNMLNAISSSGTNMVPVGDDQLGSFFQNIEGVEGYKGAMVSIEEAKQHIAQTAQELQQLLEQVPTEEEVEDSANEAESLFDGL